MTKSEKMLDEISCNLAILELASKSLSDVELMKTVFSVKEKSWGFEDYALELSYFAGRTLRLLRNYQIELDEKRLALQCNVQNNDEKGTCKVRTLEESDKK